MRFFFFLLFILFSPSAFAEAQSINNAIYGDQNLTIELEPFYPGPGEEFTAKANDYALPVSGVGIRWFVDGKFLATEKNERQIKLTAPAIGQKLTIELIVDLASGDNVSVKKVIEPIYLDIIVEPQTRTPAFYQGRALPSIGSTVNATAIINGGEISPSGLIYSWRINGKALEGGSVRSKNVTSFEMPRGKYSTLSLDVRRVDGETISRKVFDLISAEPSTTFYEINELYGLRTKSITDSITLSGASVSVRAEPYYLDLETYNRPDFLEWSINNLTTPNQAKNPYEITLSGAEGSGTSNVEFHVRNTTQLLQGVKGNFLINF